MGVPVTAMPQCDRAKPAVASGQKGFIGFVVKPTFDALADFAAATLRKTGGLNGAQGLQSALENIAANLAFWKYVQLLRF